MLATTIRRRRRLFPAWPCALKAAFSTAPSADSTVSYLVSRCGLSATAAARTASSLQLRLASPRGTAQADAVLALLRRYGFSETDISAAVSRLPALLSVKTLQPKLDFFASVGVEAPLLPRLVAVYPAILRRSVRNHLQPLFASLREVLGSDARVVAAFNKAPFAIRCQPKSSFFLTLPLLRDVHGLSADDVSKLVALEPAVISLAPNRINEIVEAARNVGVRPGDSMFVCLFGTLINLKASTLESKVALYRRLGFHKDAVTQLIRRFPSSVLISEKKITENVAFLTDKLGLTCDDILSYPAMLSRSLEAHSRRCAVLAVLRRAGKQPEHRLPKLLVWTEKRFREEYVKRHVKEVPDVLRAMNGEIPFQGFDSLEDKPKLPRKKMSV